jgi:DNA repair protein RecO (recombination protein O)
MSREQRRIQLAPGYILHHRPYRDTSRILEVLTRDHGRLTLFARGARGPKARLASILQPFEPLLLSWSGRGESAQLTGAESIHPGAALPPASVMSAFYLNELLLNLTTRHDPLPGLFENYHATLQALRLGEALAPRLRIFEKRLLEALGYGIDLTVEAQTGRRIEADAYYHFRPARGLLPATADAAGAVAGHSVLCLAAEQLTEEGTLEDARRLLKAALAECLEGRELRTRTVARSIVRREMGK